MVFNEIFLSLNNRWTECERPHDCQQLFDASDVLIFGI